MLIKSGMKIEHTKAQDKGHFDAVIKEGKAGTMSYTWNGEKRITIKHTEVYSEFEGEGVGKKLVREAVEFARQENLNIEGETRLQETDRKSLAELHEELEKIRRIKDETIKANQDRKGNTE